MEEKMILVLISVFRALEVRFFQLILCDFCVRFSSLPGFSLLYLHWHHLPAQRWSTSELISMIVKYQLCVPGRKEQWQVFV